MALSNLELAELLARQAEELEGNKSKACRRASRAALFWLEEVGDVLQAGRPLTELGAVGPWLSKLLESWMQDPPGVELDPPPLRADFASIAWARQRLTESAADGVGLRGDLQMHTVASDGSGTVEDMAAEAEERGYEYIAVTDHSKGLKIAGGMDEVGFAEQHRTIDAVNAGFARRGARVRVLKGIEMNLAPDGSGDMPEDILREMDVVLGSFHSKLRVKEDQTARYLAAFRNPFVHILGHPRGRIYNFRLGLVADWPAVFAEAASLDKAVEVDSYPDRQDLDIPLLKLAAESGCRISLGTDAHAPWQLFFIDIGVAACMEAGVSRDRILNFMPADDLLEWSRSLTANNLA